MRFGSPEDARERASRRPQNLALVEDLTVWQNLFLNRELARVSALGPEPRDARKGRSRWSRGWPSTSRGRIPRTPALGRPTASRIDLSGSGFHLPADHHGRADRRARRPETARVEQLITRLRAEGHAIILISHNFAQVLQLTQRSG